MTLALLVVTAAAVGAIWWFGSDLPDTEGLAKYEPATMSRVYSRITSYNVCYTKLLRDDVVENRQQAQVLEVLVVTHRPTVPGRSARRS